MTHEWPFTEGAKTNPYKYALALFRNNYIDLSSFDNLKKKRRSFNIYRWHTSRSTPKGYVVSGWGLWLQYKDRKWEKFVKADGDYVFVGPCMAPAHLFFKTGDELKEWLGPKNVNKMFAELL